MTIATVREAIHERLDPVIEEIVSREISQRGAYPRGGMEEQGAPFQALMPVLLSTIMQRRPAGAETGIENILPLLLPSLIQRRAGPEQGSPIQAILPLLLPLLLQRRQAGAETGIENILPLLLPTLIQRRPEQEGRGIEQVLPLLLSVISQRQAGQEMEQEHPLQKLAPVLVAALSAR